MLIRRKCDRNQQSYDSTSLQYFVNVFLFVINIIINSVIISIMIFIIMESFCWISRSRKLL